VRIKRATATCKADNMNDIKSVPDLTAHAANMLRNGNAAADVITFLSTSFVDKHRTDHRTVGTLHTLMVAVRGILKDTTDLLDEFKLSREQLLELKRGHEAAVLRKNESLIVIPDATKLLRVAESMLNEATPEQGNASLIIPLLLVSGRRMTEICSLKSKFERVLENPYTCVFTGALKKRNMHAAQIPLLVSYDTFIRGLQAFRVKQASGTDIRGKKDNAVQLSNKQLSNRYCTSLNNALKKNQTQIKLPMYVSTRVGSSGCLQSCHIHDLRAIYGSFVCSLFVNDESVNRVLMRCLLHESLAESLSYTNVKLENVESIGCLGRFY
jgi:hypothetical protein